MIIRELNISEVRRTYKQHIKRDFPAAERKPLAVIERCLERGEYLCLGAFDGDDMAGYAFFVFCGRICLLDYFAVLPDRRGTGIGSAMLKELGRYGLRERCDILLIEVEDPLHVSGSEQTVRHKRLEFYQKNGIISTGVTAVVFGVEYLLLEYPLGTTHTPMEAAEAYDTLYRSLLPGLIYRRNIFIRT